MVEFMDPESALALQIAHYQHMTGEERVALALELHEFACDLARAGIRAQHPSADASQIERLLRQRLEVATKAR